MQLRVVGLSHRTASIAIRERFALKPQDLTGFLTRLRGTEAVGECMALSTCNRSEIYAITSLDAGALIDRVCRIHGLPEQEFRSAWFAHEGLEAVRHACRVAAGLDSMVVGEPQVLGQLKDAYQMAAQSGAAAGRLRQLFEQVFSVAKKIRTKTGVGQNPLSVSYAAVKKARDLFGSLDKCSALMIGAGNMGELTVRNLKTEGIAEVYISNRTFSRAVDLSEKLGGIPIMAHEVPDYLPKVDIVIVSLNADGYAVGTDQVGSSLTVRNQNGLLIIDISVPRAVDPQVGDINKVLLYNVDDLNQVVTDNQRQRALECQKAESIIALHVEHILQSVLAFDIVPVITLMRERAETMRRKAYAELVRDKSDALTPEDVEAITIKMVNQIMHQTTLLLREFAARGQNHE
jgi:glutamyl-tRNA reductase